MPLEVKRKKTLEFPRPKCIAELRRFLGMTNWFRKFIPEYARISCDLYELLKCKTEFMWSEKEEIAFDQLKEALRDARKLKLPEYNKEFTLKTDASNTGLGAVLLQKNDLGKCGLDTMGL